MRKVLKILWSIIVTMAVLLFAAWLLIQMPPVQTFIAKRITRSLEDKFGGKIEFSSVHLKPFNALVLKDVKLIDDNPPVTPEGEVLDTLAKAQSITATFSIKGLFKKEGLHLGKVYVGGASFTLVTEEQGSNISRFFGSSGKNKEKEKKEMGRIFDADKVQISDFRFRLLNLKHPRPSEKGGINWTDLDITVHDLEAKDLDLSNGYMKGEVERLSATEKSGYNINSLSGKTTVGGGAAIVEGLRLTDDWSDIRMDEYHMRYESIESFNDFLNEVRLGGTIRNSVIDFNSLGYFATALKPMNVRLNVSKAFVDGPVSDLGIDRIEFLETGSGVSGKAEGRISGLPDINTTVLDFFVEDLDFTTEGLGKFVGGFAPSARLSLGKFAPGERIAFDGSVKGTLNDLAVSGKVDTKASGSIKTDLKMKDIIKKSASMVFGGSFATNSLNIGSIAGIKQLGEATMRGAVTATLAKKGGIDLKIDSLLVDKFKALDYEYSNIMAAGTYSDEAFDGRLICSDPNLNLLFQGIFTLSDNTSNGLYKFYADIGYADLQALGLDKRGVSKVAGRINANYMTVGKEDVIGDLDVLDIELENSLGKYDVGDVRIRSHTGDGLHRIRLNSDFADISYSGSKPFTGIVGDLKELTLLEELPALCKDTVKTWDGARYDVRLDVHDIRDVLSFAMPGLYVADSTKARLTITGEGDIKAFIQSSRIAIKKNYLRNLDLAFDNRGGSLNVALNGSELAVGGLVLNNDQISLYASDNHVGLGCSYDNRAELADKGDIFLSGELSRESDGRLLIDGKTLPSSIWFNAQQWKITPASFSLLGKDFTVDKLTAASGGQSIKVGGGFSSSKNDTLNVDLVRFDMGLVNKVLGKDLGIKGLATGNAMVTSPWNNNAGLTLSIGCDSVMVAGREVGSLDLSCDMDDSGMLNMLVSNSLDGKKTLDISGGYSTKDKNLDVLADLDGMDAGYISPFLESVFSEMGGHLNGKVRINGPTNNLSFSSEGTSFDNVMLRVAYTNVPYFANGPFTLDNNGLHLDGVAVRDRFDGTGKMSGGILFNHLKDIRMATGISMTRMEALNLDSGSGQPVYGNVFASGNVSIKGPFNAIKLDVDARTDKDGAIHIPMDNSSSDANTNLLTFKEPYKPVYIDPYDLMMNKLQSVNKQESDFGIRLKIAANQRTEAFVEIDRASGNALNGRGQGNIDIDIRPSSGLFAINGEYTLSSGNFHFNAMDIAQKDFSLSQGSSIRFNGDVMDSDLDIDGVYSTKASIATLIADTTSISSRKVVNCGIGISGKLREPQLSFSIDVPDVDAMTKSRIESALNTEDKVQRQFLSLLISGGFMPEEQSGIVNNTSTLYNNLADIMAGQLNNILQKLEIPLDLGLNYQSSQSGTSIFDVAVTTQLFNNRVIVNGNVGNREYGNTSEGEVVGDLDIEIKLDKPGQVRLKLFSHSSDDYTSYLDNTQRNGVGVTYQKEFYDLRDLANSIFTSKKKRQERANAPQPERELQTITIESTGKP
ncbi:MAG: hypothetical protein IKW99_10455 [Bacteroidales bacterium]|nr:hypothetical protein [Bacteroidales bacterium]